MKFKNQYLVIMLIISSLIFSINTTICQERIVVTHGPYLIDPATDAITVVWFTNNPSLSWVDYCGDGNFGTFPNWGGYPKTVKNSNHGLIEANTTRHVIRITDLKPGTAYKYRVTSKEIREFNPYEVLYGDTFVSDVRGFTTLDPRKETFSFGLITDIHEKATKLDTLLQQIPTDSLDMIFYNGDMLNWIGAEERIFNGFLDVSVDHFAKEKPFIFIRGNHETRGPAARGLFSYFPHSSGKFYHAFSQGNVHFTILDAGEDKPDDHPVYAGLVDFDNYRTEQQEWIAKVFKTTEFINARYKIVLVHIPPFSESKGHGGKDITQKWGPIFNEAGIDLILSGHHHRFAKIDPSKGKNNFPILVIGKDMIVKTDVSPKELKITIWDMQGNTIETITLPAG